MIVDIGTGDGRYVYRSARANPDKFYIGIDVQPKALEEISEKVHRKPERGGLPNVLFVQAPVEQLPPELDHVADEIHIHFPWGSLLRSVAIGDKEVLGGLRRIAAREAWLEVVIGIDESRDAAEAERPQLPPMTEEYVRLTLMPRYDMAGFKFLVGVYLAYYWSQARFGTPGSLSDDPLMSFVQTFINRVQVWAASGGGRWLILARGSWSPSQLSSPSGNRALSFPPRARKTQTDYLREQSRRVAYRKPVHAHENRGA